MFLAKLKVLCFLLPSRFTIANVAPLHKQSFHPGSIVDTFIPAISCFSFRFHSRHIHHRHFALLFQAETSQAGAEREPQRQEDSAGAEADTSAPQQGIIYCFVDPVYGNFGTIARHGKHNEVREHIAHPLTSPFLGHPMKYWLQQGNRFFNEDHYCKKRR